MPRTIFAMVQVSLLFRADRRHRARAASRGVEPIEDDAGDLVAVVFQHQHVAVADNTAVGEKAEVGLGTVGIEPVDDGAVDLARMVEIGGAGDDEHALAGELARVAHPHLAAVHVLPLEQDIRRDRAQRCGITGEPVARENSGSRPPAFAPRIRAWQRPARSCRCERAARMPRSRSRFRSRHRPAPASGCCPAARARRRRPYRSDRREAPAAATRSSPTWNG